MSRFAIKIETEIDVENFHVARDIAQTAVNAIGPILPHPHEAVVIEVRTVETKKLRHRSVKP